MTATAKDSTDWRTFRDLLTKSGDWIRCTLYGRDAVRVGSSHWLRMKRER
jgi:hypothetical protein